LGGTPSFPRQSVPSCPETPRIWHELRRSSDSAQSHVGIPDRLRTISIASVRPTLPALDEPLPNLDPGPTPFEALCLLFPARPRQRVCPTKCRIGPHKLGRNSDPREGPARKNFEPWRAL